MSSSPHSQCPDATMLPLPLWLGCQSETSAAGAQSPGMSRTLRTQMRGRDPREGKLRRGTLTRHESAQPRHRGTMTADKARQALYEGPRAPAAPGLFPPVLLLRPCSKVWVTVTMTPIFQRAKVTPRGPGPPRWGAAARATEFTPLPPCWVPVAPVTPWAVGSRGRVEGRAVPLPHWWAKRRGPRCRQWWERLSESNEVLGGKRNWNWEEARSWAPQRPGAQPLEEEYALNPKLTPLGGWGQGLSAGGGIWPCLETFGLSRLGVLLASRGEGPGMLAMSCNAGDSTSTWKRMI